MTIEFSVAQENFKKLVQEFSSLEDSINPNEAQTRFSYIDTMLMDCLGWTKDLVRVEVYENGDRSDYECGIPRQLIIEAKKPGISFSFPPSGNDKLKKIKLQSITNFNALTKSGIEQVIEYCFKRGVPIAVLCNGPQLIMFLASRLDGISPLEADAIVFDSYVSQEKNFNIIFECLSLEGVLEKRLSGHLSGEKKGVLPTKLSALCVNYFEYKYSSTFQENIRNASSLIIEDIGRTSELEPEFLKECYCESGPLSQYSLLGKNILTTRYSALFSSDEAGSRIEDVNPRKNKEKINDKILAEALARRPIVFLGDVGVGKTSFIRNLIQNSEEKEINESICIYFDLGNKATLSKEPKDALLEVIENTLRDEYKINIQDSSLLELIYKEQLLDFDNGFMGALKNSQPDLFMLKRLEYIQSLLTNKSEHLRKCLKALGDQKKSQVIIIIDNADQRNIDVQQEAFLIAHELASTWNALVFLSVRPQTFHSSKRSGTISAYPPKVFVIPPPKLEDVIEKRLAFALKIAEGRLPLARLKNLSLHVESLAILIRVLRSSLKSNPELYEFIVNVSSGNVRVAIELISKFFGNPNVESERIVKITAEGGNYVIPVHEFSKGGLLGDNSFYQEDGSYACNIFSVFYADKREHFLSILILGYLSWDGALKDKVDGFIGLDAIYKEMQSNSFTTEQTKAHLLRLTRKKLVETTERRLLETERDVTDLGMPESFRITPLGAYHIKRWMFDFGFLEAMSFDTPIFTDTVRKHLEVHVNDHTLVYRYERSKMFKNYLNEVWVSILQKPYFDWNNDLGSDSFARVEKQLSDFGKLPVIQ